MTTIYRKGLTELHSGTGPGGEPPKVSIVFIHGLGGHPERTWSAANAEFGSDSSDRRASDSSDVLSPSRKASIISWARHFKSSKIGLPDRSLSRAQSTYSVDHTSVTASPPEIEIDPLTAEPECISPPAASPRGIASNPLSRSTSIITAPRGTSPSAVKSSKIFWPRDLLPSDFPDARIFTYGYDADVVKRPFGKDSDSLTNPSETSSEANDPVDPKAKLNFMELAHTLLVALNRSLPDDVPVIICAHSLGGVLTKRALWESRTHVKDRNKHKLAKLTKAVFFFGTPHKGSSTASWGKIGANIAQSLHFDASTKIVTRLQLDSEMLEYFHSDFMKLLDEGRFWVHTFQESQALTPVLGKVVEDYSSKIDDTPLQQFEKLPGNHRTMIQFSSSRSEGYRRVKDCLKDYIRRFDSKHDAERRSIASAHSAMSLNSNTYYCLPYHRNERFTGREETLDAIDALFSPPQSSPFVALYGLGGIGKTQVAIELAERWKYRYPSYSIFWVHATDQNALDQGLQNIAKTLGFPESADTDIPNLIQKWLENRDNGRWFLVIDNVDNIELLNANKGKMSFEMLPWIPKVANGKVLFTTRHKSVAMELSTQQIQLDPMSELEALDLMRTTFANDWQEDQQKDALELLEELSYIPLAIVHATCFMRSEMLPIKRYLSMYRESEESREELLEEFVPGLDKTDISDAPKTVLTTTRMSLDRVADHVSGPLAIELISFMTFLHRQNIPLQLLQAYRPKISSFKLNKALGAIKGHSLVIEDQKNETLSMHRLVQLSVRRWLTRKDREGWTERYREDALKLVSEQFPDGSFETWSKCDSLIIHAETVLKENPDSNDRPARAKLLQNVANYQNGKGQYAAAEQKLTEVVKMLSEINGPESEKVLRAQDQLSWTMRCQAKKDAALQLSKKTLEIKKKVYGEGHAEVLTTAHIIATVVGEQGKHQEAAALHQANFDARKELLGEKHLDTLRSAANLSLELWELGKFSEAEDLARETLASRQELLGAAHPDSLDIAGTLGFILEIQGKLEEAKQIKQQMLEYREKLYGDDHPDTADSCHDMGWIYHQMGNYDAASPMYARALEAKTKLLGQDHWKTLTTKCNYPVFFCDMGHYDEGETRYKDLIETFKRVQGPEHPQTLDATGGLAVILRHQAVIYAYRNDSEGYNAKLAEAAECARRSIDGRNKVLGPDHPWTLPPLSHWGYILTLQGEYKKGEEVIRDALAKLEEKMGAEASNVLTSLMFLSKNLYFQATTLVSKPFHADNAYDPNDARLVEAEELARRALASRKKLLGEDHPYYFKTMHHLAKVVFARGDRAGAIQMAKEALNGLRRVLGDELGVEHPDSARAWVEIVGMEMGLVVGIGEVDVSGETVK